MPSGIEGVNQRPHGRCGVFLKRMGARSVLRGWLLAFMLIRCSAFAAAPTRRSRRATREASSQAG